MVIEKCGDRPIEEVRAFLASKVGLAESVGNALRQAFDEVIDGPRTARYRIEQLEKTEKTYIGTKVEIILRDVLALDRGTVLDNLISGHEVDTKFSLSGGWMIPPEAVGKICMVVKGDDNTGLFSLGLIRATEDVLTIGANQDRKRSISAAGRSSIQWIIQDHPMPRNFFLGLTEKQRSAIMSPRSGKQRIVALFREITGKIIPRSAIPQVSQLQGDPLRRAREAKATLALEGIQVLCARFEQDRAEFHRHGFDEFDSDDWLSIKLS